MDGRKKHSSSQAHDGSTLFQLIVVPIPCYGDGTWQYVLVSSIFGGQPTLMLKYETDPRDSDLFTSKQLQSAIAQPELQGLKLRHSNSHHACNLQGHLQY